MQHPTDIEFSAAAGDVFGDELMFGEPLDSADLEKAAMYQEIADRRAQLECAEILRRARAL